MKKMIRKFLNQDKKYLIIEAVSLLLIIILSIFLILYFGKSKVENNNTNKNDTPEVVEKEVKIIDVNSKTRPIAIMINNATEARPYQRGLQEAYIVYEMINYADGSTRFLALFKDKDLDEIGPIRSARHYHLDYVMENDAIFVHWGYSPKAESDLKTLGINNINGLVYGSNSTKENLKSGSYFWTNQVANLSIAHRRFTSSKLLNEAIDKFKYRKETEQDNLLKYTAEEISIDKMESEKANKVDIYYAKNNNVTYEYDEAGKMYLRSVKNVAHKDATTNEQLKVKNIITYKIKNTLLEGDTESRQDLHNIGDGEGYYITSGYAVKIKWSKKCRECQTKYTYLDGKEIEFNDGNTFIQIQPEGQDLKIS